MMETKSNRYKQITSTAKNMTLNSILDTFPRFKDFNGELVGKKMN